MKFTSFLLPSLILIAFQIQGQQLQTPITKNDTLPDKEVFEMLEAMKLPEKLKEIFLKMKNDLLFQGLDQSGPFYSKGNFSQHTWDSIENKFITEITTDLAVRYSHVFDKKDLKMITKFYKSSHGQKMMIYVPEIQKEMSSNIRMWMHKTEFELGLMKADEDHKKMKNAPTDCSQFSEGRFVILLPENTSDTFSITGNTAMFGDNDEPYEIEWIKPCSYRLTEISEGPASEPMTIEINIYELRANSYLFLGKSGDGASFEGEVIRLE